MKAWETQDCWPWPGAKDERGYGRVAVNRKNRRAHRVVYEDLVGPIPTGLELDHLCRNTSCVNPAHLEPVTRRENLRRSPTWAGNRTCCPRGHTYDATTTRTNRGLTERYCRRCQLDAQRRHYERSRHHTLTV